MLYHRMEKVDKWMKSEKCTWPKTVKLYFQVMSRLAFCLWMRIDEGLTMQMRDVEELEDMEGGLWRRVVRLRFRKTSQENAEGQGYNLFNSPDEPAACGLSSLNEWMEHLEKAHGTRLAPKDLLFPKVNSKTKIIDLGVRMPQSGFLELLRTAVEGACLYDDVESGAFTLHCFRRGGAQHRFIHATPRWSITAVKWWGGWSADESPDVISKYLLEEVSRYENDYGDMMNPRRNDARQAIQEDRTCQIGQIEGTLASMAASMRQTNEAIFQRFSLLERSINDLAPSPSPSPAVDVAVAVAPAAAPARPVVDGTIKAIPDISSWRGAVTQWNEGQPSKGLLVPLKGWTAAMIKNDRKTFYKRKIIVALEYIRLGGDRFEQVYASSLKSINGLMASIAALNKDRVASE